MVERVDKPQIQWSPWELAVSVHWQKIRSLHVPATQTLWPYAMAKFRRRPRGGGAIPEGERVENY